MRLQDEELLEPQEELPPEVARVGFGSWARILGLGLLCAWIGALWEQQAQLIKGTCHVAESVPPLSAVAALIFLLALKPALRAVGAQFGMSRREILCTYAFVCVAVTIGFIGLYRQVLGLLTTPVYGPQDDTTILAIRPHLPDWLIPTDSEVIRKLWEGSKGEGVPWGAWLKPLAGLGGLFVLFFFTTACLIGLFHRRWARDERLRYPVAELAAELVGKEDSGSGFSAVMRSQTFWLGGALALAFNLYYILPALNPEWSIPPVQYDFHSLGLDLPWRAGGPGPFIRLNPIVFGLGFLVSTDLLLTIWVMVIVLKLEAVVAYYFGVPYWPLFHIRHQEGLGAYIGLALVMVGAGRRYILQAVKDFVKPGRLADGAPGRWTLVGLSGGIALLLVLLVRAGMVPWFAIFFLAMVLIRVLVMARVRAQAGIPNIYLHVIEIRSFLWLLGGGTLAALGHSTLAALVFMSFLISCTAVTPYQADGFRLAELTGFGYRRWIWLSTFGVLAGFILASYFHLTAIYEYGFNNLRQPLSTWPANEIIAMAQQGDPAEPLRWVMMGAGLATTAVLAMVQAAYHWFPFSPVGFVVACAIGDYVFGPVLLAWIVKQTVLKIGGGPAYQSVKTACIGLVFTHLTIASLWALGGLFDLKATQRYVIGFW